MILNDSTRQFILHWGEMGTRWGVNRTVAQVHALLDDGEEECPDVGGGLEEVAAVAHAAVGLDEVPILQLFEAGADVGAGDGEGLCDFLSGEGFGREVEEGVDLGDGAVYAPAGTHFSPMEDELAGGVGECHVSSISVISVVTEITDTVEEV